MPSIIGWILIAVVIMTVIVLCIFMKSLEVKSGYVVEKRRQSASTKVAPSYGELGLLLPAVTFEAPERWILVLEDLLTGDQGEVEVSRDTWEAYQLGEHYPKGEA